MLKQCCTPTHRNRLKDSKKHSSRRSKQTNQQISIINSDNAGINPNAHPQQMQMQPQQQQSHYDNRMNTQVKTYTDHGNGHSVMRTGNSSHYSKVYDFIFLISPLSLSLSSHLSRALSHTRTYLNNMHHNNHHLLFWRV
jgi:hypothetical protein